MTNGLNGGFLINMTYQSDYFYGVDALNSIRENIDEFVNKLLDCYGVQKFGISLVVKNAFGNVVFTFPPLYIGKYASPNQNFKKVKQFLEYNLQNDESEK